MLLNIPPQKTLLRRHLTTKFNALIGPEAEQEKREKMASPAYTPLTTTAKVRVSLQALSGVPLGACLPALLLYGSGPGGWSRPSRALPRGSWMRRLSQVLS